MQVLVGCDPELFVKNNSGFLSAYNLIPGTKKEPHPVNHGAVQVDGMALEFNIEPASTAEEFSNNIIDVMNQLYEMVPTHYKLDLSSSARFSPDVMNNQPKEALDLGCDPDFNAYTMDQNPSPRATGDISNLRTASGHIHIGWTEDNDPFEEVHVFQCAQIIKQLDYVLGSYSVLEDPDGHERRQLYGKAGSFRPKPYGVEYRTLSNYWIKDKILMEKIYDRTITSLKLLETGVSLFKENEHVLEKAINDSDVEQCSQFIQRYKKARRFLKKG